MRKGHFHRHSHWQNIFEATSTAIRSRRLLATGPDYAPISDYSRSFNADLNGNPMVCNGLNPISVRILLQSLQEKSLFGKGGGATIFPTENHDYQWVENIAPLTYCKLTK